MSFTTEKRKPELLTAAAAAGPWPTFCQRFSPPRTLASYQNSVRRDVFAQITEENNCRGAKFASVATDQPDACGSVGDGAGPESQHTSGAPLGSVLGSPPFVQATVGCTCQHRDTGPPRWCLVGRSPAPSPPFLFASNKWLLSVNRVTSRSSPRPQNSPGDLLHFNP